MKFLVSMFFVLSWTLSGRQAQKPLEIHHIANEGVLIRVGEDQVIIDGLFESAYPDYESTTDETLTKIGQQSFPFTSLDLLLVSHVHSDHFTPNKVKVVLKQFPQLKIYANKQTLDSLGLEKDEQIIEFDHAERVSKKLQEITVTTFPIPHSGRRWTWIENTAHLIEIGDYKILHVGDPSSGEALINSNLANEQIDVAILPYWFFRSTEAYQTTMRIIGARKYIANHIPVVEKKRITGLYKNDQKVFVIENEPLIYEY